MMSKRLVVFAIAALMLTICFVIGNSSRALRSIGTPDESCRVHHPDGTSIIRPRSWKVRRVVSEDFDKSPNMLILAAGGDYGNAIQVVWPIELTDPIPSSATELTIASAGEPRRIYVIEDQSPRRRTSDEYRVTIWADYPLAKTSARCRADLWSYGDDPGEIAAVVVQFIETLRSAD